jgi:MoaA/NifB/PqqE/SkfB family radical SAM enzyme
MKIQYINKENHTVYDDKEYVFKENKIKDVSDKLGNYLTSKYRASFVKVDEKQVDTIFLSNIEHKLQPTKRFMIEPSLDCNIKCKFCYHLHRFDTWKQTIKSLDEMKKQVDAGKERGNTWVDITGGEPTIYPYIIELIKYIKTKGLKVCIITNGIVGKVKTQKLIDAGLDEFLVSRHGMEKEHNFITNTQNGYSQQCKFLNQIKDKVQLRFNIVLTKYNQKDIENIGICLSEWNPKIINFINFNPHHEWKNEKVAASDIIADLRIVKKELNKIIPYLESKGIGVNVRYYPMCRIAEKYRRCVCNDLQVMFDFFEWDYNILPKSISRFYEWGLRASNANEEKKEPCCNCDLQNICGGGNKYFHKVSNKLYGETFNSQKIDNINKMDYNYYRKLNKLCISST